jgi:outer membrane receptor protein involved in Fe transport
LHNKCLVWIICLIPICSGVGQGLDAATGSIKGSVRSGDQAIEFANVFVRHKHDTIKIVSGTITDGAGAFTLAGLPLSNYILTVQIVGYVRTQVDLALSESHSKYDVGVIQLKEDVVMLNSVEVKAVRELIEKTDEGFVVNASSNLTQIGGTAADLLRNMPGVLVDADGAITIRGKSPLTLINGRTSGIAGADRTAQLDRIPASAIDRIEIIHNPSAKYDADAEAGIINIILKKEEGIGTNGAFAIGAGFGERYRLNGSVLVNHNTGKWNFGAAYDNWYTTRTRRVEGDRVNYELPDKYYLTQRRFDERLIFYQNAKATVDFVPNDKNALRFEALWAFPGEDNNETLRNAYHSSDNDFTSGSQRHSNEIRRTHNVELSLNYKKQFADPEKFLAVSASNAYGNDRENTDITSLALTEQSNVTGTSSLQRTHTYQKSNIGSLSVDYAQPAGAHAVIETGYKGILRQFNADFERSTLINDEYLVDPMNSNVFDFDEQIHAVYLQLSGWAGEKTEPKWKYNAGLRAEQVWNNGATIDESEDFTSDYFYLYPSGSFFYHPSANTNIKVSYSRRINRPGLGQLNPFTDITDSLNQRAGNPRLKPELVHSLEAGYNYSGKRIDASITPFYRLRSDAIFPYTILDENGVAFTQPLNFGTAATFGIEAIASYRSASFWDLNFSLSAFKTSIKDDGDVADLAIDRVSWYTKLINSFSIGKGGKLQLAANYVSPTAIPQGSTVAVYNVDIGFQQSIIKGKGRLGLVITDVFNTQKSGVITSDYNFEFSRIFKLDTRAFMATFGYTFGSTFRDNLMENKFKND